MEDTYTVDEAARVLKLTPGRIRQMLRGGEFEAIVCCGACCRTYRIGANPRVVSRRTPATRLCLESILSGAL